jgi:membrane protein DedA with SNARE-associated domain
VENLATFLINTLDGVPALAIYALAAAWVGVECIGIGLPVEPVMLFVGSLAASGHINVVLAIVMAGVGCVVLGSISYVLGWRFGNTAITRYGRFVGLAADRSAHLETWLRRRGALGVMGLRSTPLVRSWCSFVSGIAEVSPANFIVGTFVGSAFYSGVWLVVGDLLGKNYRAPLAYLDRFGWVGVAAIAAIVLVVLVLHRLTGIAAFLALALHFHRHEEHMRPVLRSQAAAAAPAAQRS